jgi:hypothetical protein
MIADDLSAVLINHHHSWAWEMSVDDVLTVFYVDDYSWLYISCLTDSDHDWPAMYFEIFLSVAFLSAGPPGRRYRMRQVDSDS